MDKIKYKTFSSEKKSVNFKDEIRLKKETTESLVSVILGLSNSSPLGIAEKYWKR